jgi:hypothetical protein
MKNSSKSAVVKDVPSTEKKTIANATRKFTRDEMVVCAATVKACWKKHTDILSADPLAYLDVLIDTIWDNASANTWPASSEVGNLAPGILPGTIDRLFMLKAAHRKHIISAANH